MLPNLDSSVFNINMPTSQPTVGCALVAEPFLREEHFNHAVIALVDYSIGKSSMGLVLNKPTGYTIGETIEGIDDEVDIPLYCGGPLSNDRLFYLHTLGAEIPGGTLVAHDMYIGGDFDKVKDYINMGFPTEGKIRFFIGYSGWDAMQLEDEIARHVWAVKPNPSTYDMLNTKSDAYWYHFVKSLGKEYRHWMYHPVNPMLN